MGKRRRQLVRTASALERLERRVHLAAQMVKDINLTPTVVDPPALVQLNSNTALFACDDTVHGIELWRTDGTPGGTSLVRDIVPGAAGADISSLVSAGDGLAFFLAAKQLWKSDGTEAGTRLVKDFSTGGFGTLEQLTPSGDKLFFVTSTPTLGSELYVSDGTAAGTMLVTEINPGNTATFIRNITAIGNGGVMFGASQPAFGIEPWYSDGSAAGTFMVADVNAGSADSEPYDFTESNGQIFFATTTATFAHLHRVASPGSAITTLLSVDTGAVAQLTDLNGVLMFSVTTAAREELWRSDGSIVGTMKVIDIRTTLPNSGLPSINFTNVNGTLYFAGNNGSQGQELWKSDGTPGGSGLVAEIRSGASSSTPEQFTFFSGRVYFSATHATSGQELWSTDGTTAGTSIVKDIAAPGSSRPLGLMAINGRLVFSATTTADGQAIYQSNGTANGTTVAFDLPKPNQGSTPTFIGAMNGKVVFSAAPDGFSRSWISDGTLAGTFQVAGGVGSTIASIGTRFFYSGFDATSGSELWWTDGTPTGASLIKNIRAGSASSSPLSFTAFNGNAYFSADDGAGAAFWKSDGTDAGTIKLTAATGAVSVGVVANNTLFVKGTGGLWKTDGTPGGTVKVNAGTLAITSELIAANNGIVFFMVSDQLWRSDGTPGGTAMVKDLAPTGTTTALGMRAFGAGGVAFVAKDPLVDSYFLWVSDGSTAGTVPLRDLVTGTPPIDPLEVVNDKIYFPAYEDATGSELWISDGTVAGTHLLKDVWPGFNSGDVSAISSAGPDGRVYFVANDGIHGDELWTTDGTTGGSVFVQDINPGRQGIDPGHSGAYSVGFTMDATGEQLFFAADDGAHGREPWVFVPEIPPFAFIENGTLIVNGTSAADTLSLTYDETDVSVELNSATLTFALDDFTSVQVNAGDGNDTLTIAAPDAIASPIRFAGGAGNDAMTLASGTLTITGDANSAGDEFAMTVLSGATANFNLSQHFSALTVDGSANLAASAGPPNVIVTRTLELNGAGRLDLNNNALILDYASAPSPLAGVANQIRTARANGAWTGVGITSAAARDNPLHNTTLGAIEAGDFKSIYGPAATFAGESIDATAVLVEYTYYGDADFNGVVNFDDYSRIDNGFATNRTGWLNGDFDHNGIVNFDDYSLIDLAFNTQGASIRALGERASVINTDDTSARLRRQRELGNLGGLRPIISR